MDEVGVVKEIDGFGELIDDILFVPLLQIGRFAVFANERMEIYIHMFKDKVDVLIIFCTDRAFKANDVRMLQLPEEHDLSIGTLRIGGVRKSIEVLLQSLDLLALPVNNLPNMAICATTDLLDHLIVLKDVGFYLICHLINDYSDNGRE